MSIKLASILNFYATGSYQRTVGDVMYHSMDQSVFSRSLHDITEKLEGLLCFRWIRYPDETEKAKMKKKNYEICKIPGIIGYVDGTHINIIAPTEHEHLFVDRRGNHSMNVQLVSSSRN